jgi:serine/threonine-protein kinase
MQPHTDPRLLALRDALAGQVLQGSGGISYHLRERIGEGGQGWVFKAAWDEPGGFIVIVKVLRPDAVTRETLTRFQREAEVLRMLAQGSRPNPHIVRFFDHAAATVTPPGGGDPLTLPYTVLEYVHGPTLEQVLASSKNEGLSVERVRRLVRHVVLALEAVHAQKVVHRDLKPSNILLATDVGPSEVAKVTDFGLVKLVDVNLQRTTALAGASLGYAPPEQYEQGNQRVSSRTDVFSLAAITFEMITGKRAFPYREGENPLLIITRILNGPRPSLTKTRDSLPQELKARPDLVERLDVELARATAADPEARHESATDLWNALDPIFRAVLPDRRSYTPSPNSPPQGTAIVASAPPAAAHAASTLENPAGPVPEATAANPASWRWRIKSRALRPQSVRAATLSPTGDAVVAVGPAGFAHYTDARGWVAMPGPAGIDPRGVRGVRWLKTGDVLFHGDGGVVGRLGPSSAPEVWAVPDREVCFLGAHRDDDGTLTLVGERPSRAARTRGAASTVGVVAQLADGKLSLLSEAAACVRLRGAARLRGGTLVACGDWGALARLELGVVEMVGAVCGGHLHAIEATDDGGALTVGAGGHALSVSPRLEAQLEAVQTTRDLMCLALGEDGSAWAGAAQARLLRRSSGSWVRMSGDLGVTGTVVGVWATPRTVRAVCDDGAILEGVLG